MLFDVDKNLSEVSRGMQDRAGKFIAEFRSFMFTQNVLALAIAVIIGTATNNVVQAMIKDLFMPVVNVVIKDQAWITWGPVIGMIDVAQLDAKGNIQFVDNANVPIPNDSRGLPTRSGGHILTQQVPNKLLVGDLVWQFTNLLVIGVIAYIMSRYLLRPPPEAPPAPPTRTCPFCLENVPVQAKVCRACARDLPVATPAAPSAGVT